MGRSILIIGAGIGGLAAGIYARLNGYPVHIVEMHTSPGGVCTGWTRHGFTFDGCIHNLAGTSPESAFHQLWRELGVIPRAPMHAYRELVAIERPGGGEPFIVHADLGQLHAEMLRLFPEDAAAIDKLIHSARAAARLDVLALTLASPLQRIAALASFPVLLGDGGTTLEHYAGRFTNPFLRYAFPKLVYDWPQQTVSMLLHFLARLDKGDMGWPVGGSLALARAMEQRFRELGGVISYQARVKSIVVEDDRAVGVLLENGEMKEADIVISNAYGPATIFDMLGGRFVNSEILHHYATPEDRIEMGVHVSLGVNRDLSSEPHAIVLPLETPVEIDGETRDRLYLQTFGFDPSLAPPGKGVIKVLLGTSWRRWEALAADPRRYKQEQELIAQAVTPLLAGRFPGIENQIEVVDVATPITTQRFTGNGVGYKVTMGEMAGALFTGHRLSQTLPGLRNFYMVGQWAGVPGVPMVAAMGRDVVRKIRHQDRQQFIHSAA